MAAMTSEAIAKYIGRYDDYHHIFQIAKKRYKIVIREPIELIKDASYLIRTEVVQDGQSNWLVLIEAIPYANTD